MEFAVQNQISENHFSISVNFLFWFQVYQNYILGIERFNFITLNYFLIYYIQVEYFKFANIGNSLNINVKRNFIWVTITYFIIYWAANFRIYSGNPYKLWCLYIKNYILKLVFFTICWYLISLRKCTHSMPQPPFKIDRIPNNLSSTAYN